MNKDNLPTFAGKCISLTVDCNTQSHDLIDPHFEYQGGRLFIIGTVPEGSSVSGWTNGCVGAVAWDRVVEYFVFDDLESFKNTVAISDDFDDG